LFFVGGLRAPDAANRAAAEMSGAFETFLAKGRKGYTQEMCSATM